MVVVLVAVLGAFVVVLVVLVLGPEALVVVLVVLVAVPEVFVVALVVPEVFVVLVDTLQVAEEFGNQLVVFVVGLEIFLVVVVPVVHLVVGAGVDIAHSFLDSYFLFSYSVKIIA